MPLVINGRFLTRPVTGVERYAHMLLQVIAKEWPDGRVVVPGTWKEDADLHGLEIVRIGGSGGHVWEQVHLPRVLRKNDILLSPANSGPLHVKRQAVVVHDLAVIHHPEWFDRRFAAWYSFLLPRLTRRAARVMTVSSTSAVDLIQTYALHPERVAIVPPFASIVDTSNADPGIGEPYYLMVGSRDPRKGYDRALAWHASIRSPQFKLVVVGRAGQAFASMEIPNVPGVIHLADVDDQRLTALYAGAIALLQPSRFEGFGLPILEALQHGCPVIASELPVFRELFGDAVLYAEIGDRRSMEYCTRAVADVEQRPSIIARARSCASEFSTQRTTQELHRALDPLLNS